MRALQLTSVLLAAVILSACGKADNGDGGLTDADSKAYSLFDPVAASAVIPFPNDGLFAGSTDGTLAIPNPSGAPFVLDANRQDGFSTVASLFTDFIGNVDLATANQPGSVIIINTRTRQALVPGVDYRVDRSTAIDPATGVPLSSLRSRLLIEPLKPLAPGTTFLVAVTRRITSSDGLPVEPADLFRVVTSATPVSDQTEPVLDPIRARDAATGGTAIARLEGIRQLYVGSILPALNGAGISTASLAIAWPFTTQSTTNTLARLAANATPQTLQLIASGKTVGDLLGRPEVNIADVYVGSLVLPYYLADATAGADDAGITPPDNPLSSFWRADPAVRAGGIAPSAGSCATTTEVSPGVRVCLCSSVDPSESTTACFPQPLARASQTVPVLVTIPNAASGKTMPVGGWPVVIFQHGITGNRSQMLPLAPAMTLAGQGFAVIAIDLPLHGLPAGHPLRVPGTTERTFDLDLVDNTSSAPPGDGTADPSGTHFINLSSLITSRDNLRQASADLLTLTASAGGAQILRVTGVDGAGNPVFGPTGDQFDGSQVRYVGHSLGGIVTSTFLGVSGNGSAGVLAMPGGGIAKLLDASASFGPRIAAGLAASTASRPAANRIIEGNDNYETFLRFAQTLVDSGDPLNFATAAVANHPVLMFEVVGDAVVPNCALSANPACPATDTIPLSGYLSGSDPLARSLGLDFLPGPAQGDALDVPAAAQTLGAPGGPALHAVVRFSTGDHGSILSPAADPLVTCEMQRQAAVFLATNGSVLSIGNCAP